MKKSDEAGDLSLDRRVNQILLEAFERSGDPAGFLEQACGGDEALLERARGLLAEGDSSGSSFMARPFFDEPFFDESGSRPSILGRTVQLLRRHAGLTASVLLALTLGAGLVATHHQARRADREAETAARTLEFMVDLFESSDPSSSGAIVTVAELLDTGTRNIRRELRDQPLIRARLLDTLGMIQTRIGQLDEAEFLVEEALAIRLRELGENHSDVAVSLEHRATLHRQRGEDAKAEALTRQAMAIRER